MKWKIVTIKSISKQIRGVSYTPKDVSSIPLEGHIRLLRANNITESGIDLSDTVFVNQKCISESQKLKVGDILIAASSGSIKIVGKAILIEDEINSSFGAFCKVIRPSENVDYRYLSYYFRSSDYRQKISHLAAGANINNLRNEDLDNLEIPLPPLSTQKRIAEILDAADALRRKDQELLRKYDELAQAIFIDMFGDPVKNEKGWEVKTIKSSTNIITYGLTVRPQYMEEGIPLISARELRSGFVNYEAAPKISNADFKKLSNKCKPQNGDILFSKTGSIGHSAIVETTKDFAVTQNAARINFKTEFYEIYFIFALLRQEAFINKCISLVKGNAVKDLQLGDFSEIEIICPPIELQRKFSEISMKSNNLIKASDNNSITSNNLFKSLLQQAFKGELVK